MTSEQTWFIARHGKVVGPLVLEEVAEGLRSQIFRWLDQACRIDSDRRGVCEWKLLHEFVEDLQPLVSREKEISVRETLGERPWVIAKGGRSATAAEIGGPYALREIALALSMGELSFRDLIWREGFETWRVLAHCDEFTRENLQSALASPATSAVKLTPASDLELEALDASLGLHDEVEEFCFQSSSDALRAVVRQLPMTSSDYAKWAVNLDRPDEAVGEDLLETPPWMKVLTPLILAFFVVGFGMALTAQAEEALTLTPSEDGSSLAIQLAPDVAVNGPITVKFFAPAGHVVKGLSCERSTKVTLAPGATSNLNLLNTPDLDLPAGDYEVDAEFQGHKAHTEIQFGSRGESYGKKLEAHLKAESDEMQKQRKVLYYSALALSHLVDDLAQHDQDATDNSYFDSTTKKTKQILKRLAAGGVNAEGETAYPHEIHKLRAQAQALLGDMQILKAARSKRAVASAGTAKASPQAQQALAEIDRRKKICKDLLDQVGAMSTR